MKANVLVSDFSRVVDRWKLLGVEGVVFIPDDKNCFELLYKLKDAMPDIYIIGDSILDDDGELNANRDSFKNVYIVDSFYTNDNESEKFDYGCDTWEIHGYNALRMVVDTAVNNNTSSTDKIAEILHQNGYKGECEDYIFDENGALKPEMLSFFEISDKDVTDYYIKLAE